jgi:uncharacterized coiled-coil protein SlyX
MLKHDEEFMRQLGIVTANEAKTIAHHTTILENQKRILDRADEHWEATTKQLDRMESDAKERAKL